MKENIYSIDGIKPIDFEKAFNNIKLQEYVKAKSLEELKKAEVLLQKEDLQGIRGIIIDAIRNEISERSYVSYRGI